MPGIAYDIGVNKGLNERDLSQNSIVSRDVFEV
jgi:hypothetical protein